MSESNTSDGPSYRPTKAEQRQQAMINALRQGVGKNDEGEGHPPTEEGRGTPPPSDNST